MFGTKQESIDKLSQMVEKLVTKKENLRKKIIAETDIARSNVSFNNRVALYALKRRKVFEKHQQHIDDSFQTIEFIRKSFENASTNNEILPLIESATKAVKDANEGIDGDLDIINDMILEWAEMEREDRPNEIANCFPGPPIPYCGIDYEESEILKELEELEEEAYNKKFSKLNEIAEKLFTKKEDFKKQIIAETDIARKNATANKSIALHALIKRKAFEKRQQNIDETIQTIELQRKSLENASTNDEILQAMESSAKAMKDANDGMDSALEIINNINKVIDEREKMPNEIAPCFPGPDPPEYGIDYDEGELIEELEKIEKEILNENKGVLAECAIL